MVTLDYYASTGCAIELLAQSPYHQRHALGAYLRADVLPALSLNQARFYQTEEAIPLGMVTWAWLNEAVESQVHATGRALQLDEWNCGDRLFFNDCITPYNNMREVMHDLTHNIFPDAVATSLRRRNDGSVRRINRWTGVNIRHKQRSDQA